MNREQCAMAIADSKASQLLKFETALSRLESRKATMKARQRATLALLHKARKRETRRQAFHVRVVALVGVVPASVVCVFLLTNL